jgi:hypothetical protein
MHTAALIACTNESLLTANTRLTRKQGKKRQYIASGGVLTGEEGAVLANRTSSTKAKGTNRIAKPRKEKRSAVRSNSGLLSRVWSSIF